MPYSAILTLLCIALNLNRILSFQLPHSPRWPHRCCICKSCSTGGNDNANSFDDVTTTRSAATTATILSLPVIDDESYPNILPPNPAGVIFDMDGTLIKHAIDFAEMRRRIYSVADSDPIGQTFLERDCVLALATKLSPEGMERCNVIFSDIERKAREDMELMEGGVELLRLLGEMGLRKAVLTRNLERNVEFMSDMYVNSMALDSSSAGVDGDGDGDGDGVEGDSTEPIFHPIVARDTKSNPTNEQPITAKPHPDGILHICHVWGCDPADVIMVGDSANDDMTAANRAGCGGTVLLTQAGGKQLDTDSGYGVGDSEEEVLERTPSLRVESLGELQLCIEALLKEQRKR